MKEAKFYPQVRLLLATLPYVAKENCFALKGGTAINLFVRDFPRLSVDIDWDLLTAPRAESLPAIKWKLLNLSQMPPTKREFQVAELEKKMM